MACRSCGKSSLVLLSRSSLLEGATASPNYTPSAARRISPSSSISLSRRRPQKSQIQSRSLQTTRQSQQPEKTKAQDETATKKGSSTLANLIRSAVGIQTGSTANTYAVYGLTERWAKLCASQADYAITKEDRKAGRITTTEEGEEVGVGKGSVWHDEFHLLPTFSTWSQVSMLHLYLLAVRLRCLDRDEHERWQKQLVDHFFHQAEAKMDVTHDLGSASIRQRYLKDLFVQWRGVILAYDEGLVKGDAVLASAVWRNLFKAREDVDVRVLAAVVAWMRNCLRALDRVSDDELPLVVASLFEQEKLSTELKLVDAWSNSISAVGGKETGTETVEAAGEEARKKRTSRFA